MRQATLPIWCCLHSPSGRCAVGSVAELPQIPSWASASQRAGAIADWALEHLPKTISSVARGCAVVHWFDKEIVQALLPEDSAESAELVYGRLAELPFVETDQDRLAYHTLTREGLLARYKAETPEILTYAADRTAQVCATRTQDQRALLEAFFCYLILSADDKADVVLEQAIDRLGSVYEWPRLKEYVRIGEEAKQYRIAATAVASEHYWWVKAVMHYLEEDYVQAIASLDRAIELEPDEATYYNDRGAAYAAADRYEEAIADLERALTLEPHNVELLATRGSVYGMSGDHSRALADLDQAVEFAPYSFRILVLRGAQFARMHEYVRALEDLEQAVKLDPDEPAAYYEQACVHAQLGNTTEACQSLERAIELNSTCAEMALEDSDFEGIRDTDEFQRLVQSARAS